LRSNNWIVGSQVQIEKGKRSGYAACVLVKVTEKSVYVNLNERYFLQACLHLLKYYLLPSSLLHHCWSKLEQGNNMKCVGIKKNTTVIGDWFCSGCQCQEEEK